MDEFVTVARFLSLPELDMARGLLESEGIQCLAPEEYLGGTTGGLYGLAVGGMRLQVRAADAERATALLDQADFSAGEGSGPGEREP
jgi:hypothetical protein